jgi:RND family efflux transporter MFP subunit
MLGYCDVLSPLTGLVSRRVVDPGSLVVADSTLLTTVVCEDPIYVYFYVDERTYLDLLGKARGSSPESAHLRDMNFPVWIRLANEPDSVGFPHKGKINFKDNRVDAATGTMRMRAEFANPADEHGNRAYKSGLFARLRIPVTPPYDAILVPDEAILSDQGKKYVLIVKDIQEEEVENARQDKVKLPFGTVEYRSVMLGQPFNKDLRVIKEGVSLNDQIIVTNMQQVRPGMKVQLAPKKPAGAQ